MELILSYTAATAAAVSKLATILNAHRVRQAPATVFVAGRIAEIEREALLPAIDAAGDLADVNTATYRHIRVLRKVPWSMPQPSDRLIAEEFTRGAQAVREALGRPCSGVRPAEGAGAGFRGCAANLEAMRAAGLRWSSAYVRSTYGDSAPGDLCGPFRYAADGYPELLELPAHGWPDGAVKARAGTGARQETPAARSSASSAGPARSRIRPHWWRPRKRSLQCTAPRSRPPGMRVCRTAAWRSTPIPRSGPRTRMRASSTC